MAIDSKHMVLKIRAATAVARRGEATAGSWRHSYRAGHVRWRAAQMASTAQGWVSGGEQQTLMRTAIATSRKLEEQAGLWCSDSVAAETKRRRSRVDGIGLLQGVRRRAARPGSGGG